MKKKKKKKKNINNDLANLPSYNRWHPKPECNQGQLFYYFKWSFVPVMGDQREFDLETRVTANGDNKTPRYFTVVY